MYFLLCCRKDLRGLQPYRKHSINLKQSREKGERQGEEHKTAPKMKLKQQCISWSSAGECGLEKKVSNSTNKTSNASYYANINLAPGRLTALVLWEEL